MSVTQTRSTCPYCGVGCGVIIEAKDGQITGVLGDPEHPANFGRLCTKGSTLHLAPDGCGAGQPANPLALPDAPRASGRPGVSAGTARWILPAKVFPISLPNTARTRLVFMCRGNF